MTRIQKRELMFALIETYQSGNQTQKDFCLDKGINYSTFQFWLKRYRQNNDDSHTREERLATSGFVPIEISSSTDRCDFGFQIEYPNGIRISFGSVPEMGVIRELLNLQAA